MQVDAATHIKTTLSYDPDVEVLLDSPHHVFTLTSSDDTVYNDIKWPISNVLDTASRESIPELDSDQDLESNPQIYSSKPLSKSTVRKEIQTRAD